MAQNRGIRPVDQLIAPDVAQSIEKLPAADTDAGARKLAARYAALIDAAAVPSKYAAALDYLASLVPADDAQGQQHLRRVTSALSEHSTLSDLGPKLLDTLSALGATPRGRVLLKPMFAGQQGGKLAAFRATAR